MACNRVITTLLLLVSAGLLLACHRSSSEASGIVGTWVFTNQMGSVQWKTWDGKHFLFVAATKDGVTQFGGRGTYTFQGGSYTETPEAMPFGIDLRGVLCDRLEVHLESQNRLHLTGELPDGTPIDELYVRLGGEPLPTVVEPAKE